MLDLETIVQWTGITVFEMWLHVVGLFTTTIMLTLKLENIATLSFWQVFCPLFVASACDAYFLYIVLVRAIREYNDYKGPVFRFIFNLIRLCLFAIFEFLVCYKVEGDYEHAQVAVRSAYGVVFMPIWILISALCFQICRVFA